MNESELTLANVSSCMDGEIAQDHLDQVLLALKSDDDLRTQWSVYHQIGDALRSTDTPYLSQEFAKRFNERLSSEPVLFLPANIQSVDTPKPGRTLRRFVAMAASIVAVAGVVAVVSQKNLPEAPQVARIQEVTAAPPAASPKDVTDIAARPVSNEYLMAHRNYSAGLAMHGVVSHVRTVGYDVK